MTDPSGPNHSASLDGILERITYSNEENGWCVAKLAVPGHRGLVTAVGQDNEEGPTTLARERLQRGDDELRDVGTHRRPFALPEGLRLGSPTTNTVGRRHEKESPAAAGAFRQGRQ